MATTIYSPEYGSKLEHAIVRLLVKNLEAAGYVPVKVWNDGAYVPKGKLRGITLTEALDEVFSVCVSTLHFAPVNDLHSWGNMGVMLVVGNESDLISDWHDHDGAHKAFTEAVRLTCDATDGPLELAP